MFTYEIIDRGSSNVLDGTETIDGQMCNRFRNSSGETTTTLWISQFTGYALRKVFKNGGSATQTDETQQNLVTNIETPAGVN